MKKAFILLNLMIISCFAQTNLITQEMLNSCIKDKNASMCMQIDKIKLELAQKEYSRNYELFLVGCNRGDKSSCKFIDTFPNKLPIDE